MMDQSTFIRQILWWSEKIQVALGLKQMPIPEKINNPQRDTIKARTVYPPNWEARQKMTIRIGIDVGGTNTDAVLMDGLEVISKIKTPTTEDVTSGITTALRHILQVSGTPTSAVAGVMIGTTHFTNAVVERRHLQKTAAVRLGLPATAALPPMVDWPSDLRDVLGGQYYLCGFTLKLGLKARPGFSRMCRPSAC